MYNIEGDTMSNDTRTIEECVEEFKKKFVGNVYVDSNGHKASIDSVRYDESGSEFKIGYTTHADEVRPHHGPLHEITPEKMMWKLDNGVWEVPE